MLTCTTDEFYQIRTNKEYVNIPSIVIEHLISNPNLISGSIKLWEYLYNKAKFSKELSIKISYASISKHIVKV